MKPPALIIIPSYENALLWHERDLANSSSERFTLSHSMILLDDIIIKCKSVMENLVINENQMKKNLENQRGLIMAEKVMLELVDRGVARDIAHEILREASMNTLDNQSNLKSECKKNKIIMEKISDDEIDIMFNPLSHIGSSGEIVDNAIKLANNYISN